MLTTTERSVIEEMVRRLVLALQPESIYLFGARARGDGNADSDFDLLVIVASSILPPHQRERLAFRALCGVGVSKDVLVFTREEFQRRSKVPSSLPATVLREGRLVYAACQKSTLQQVIKETGVPNLSVITSGTADRGLFNPSNLSNALEPHLEKMQEEMDWVLFDAPPVNHFDEGLALSGMVDGVVMVVQAEKTRWEVAQSAKHRLEDSGGRILGVVLNKRKFYIPKWLYETI